MKFFPFLVTIISNLLCANSDVNLFYQKGVVQLFLGALGDGWAVSACGGGEGAEGTKAVRSLHNVVIRR